MPVSLVITAKSLEQDLFFQPGFSNVSYHQQSQSDERVILAGGDGRPQKHSQHRRIDRMPQNPVWAGADQLMVPRDSHFRAPVEVQMPPCPNCQQNECCLDARANGHEKMKLHRQEPASESRRWPEKQDQRRIQQQLMETRRHLGFGVLGWRRVSGRDAPVHGENDPKDKRGEQTPITVKNNFETGANGPASDL